MMIIEALIGIGLMIFSAFGTVLLLNFKELKVNFREMADSVIQLNIKIERVINDQVWHREEIKELKEEIHILKNKE